jgi:hypothetical protein
MKKPLKDTDRYKQYEGALYKHLLNFEGIPFPTPCNSNTFKKFEAHNPNYALNVFSFPTDGNDLSKLLPVYISEQEGRRVLSIMLLYVRGDKEQRHYVCISDSSRLMCDGSKNDHATSPRCLYTFKGMTIKADKTKITPNMRLLEHAKLCKGINGGGCQKTEYPKKRKCEEV